MSDNAPHKDSRKLLSEAPSFLVLMASRRSDSLNAKLARLAAEVIRDAGGVVDFAEMREFDADSYDHEMDLAGDFPPKTLAFRARLEESDAFVIVSPEYNFSMPGYLKNSIDWVSRLRNQPFNTRPGLLMSASPSMVGGNRGLWALRVPLEHLGARLYPEMFSLAQANKAFTEDGALKDERLFGRFQEMIHGFIDLVEAGKKYPCAKKAWIEFLSERSEADEG